MAGMYPVIKMEVNEMQAVFEERHCREYFRAFQLREYAEHLMKIAAMLDKLNKALGESP